MKNMKIIFPSQIPPMTRKLVISRTVPLLDHKKRLVRRAASDARNAWMMLIVP